MLWQTTYFHLVMQFTNILIGSVRVEIGHNILNNALFSFASFFLDEPKFDLNLFGIYVEDAHHEKKNSIPAGPGLL